MTAPIVIGSSHNRDVWRKRCSDRGHCLHRTSQEEGACPRSSNYSTLIDLMFQDLRFGKVFEFGEISGVAIESVAWY